MYGTLIIIPKEHEDAAITLGNAYKLMQDVSNKNTWVISSDDSFEYLNINKECFIKEKK